MPISLSEPVDLLPVTQLARFTADEYQSLTESGLLPQTSLELIEGMLVWKDRRDHEGSIMNIGVRHSHCVDRLHRILDRQCYDHGCFARSQLPIRLSQLSVPEPDISVVLGNPETEADQHPTAEHTWLVVEVSDSSLQQDRVGKLSQYAAASIATYWIVNLVDDLVEVYSQPESSLSKYLTSRQYPLGTTIELRLPDETLAVVGVSRVIPSR